MVRVPAAFTAAFGMLLILGCLEFDEQHVYVEHDREADRLIAVIDYEGLYAGKDKDGNLPPETMQEAIDQLQEAVELRKLALYDNHQYAFSQEERRAALMGANNNMPLGVLDDLQWLAEHITVLNAGFYTDVPGRLCGAQVVVVEPFAECVTRANRVFNAALLGYTMARPDDVDLLAMNAAVLGGHVWWRIDGHSSTVSVPMSEDGLHDLVRSWTRQQLDSDAGGSSELRRLFGLVLANPVLLWHEDGAMHLKVGMASEPSLYVTRPACGDYVPNLVDHVRGTYGLELDALLARYMLEPEAAAETEAEMAAKTMASRLAKEAEVRVLIRQLTTAPSEPYLQMLRDVGQDLPHDGPGPDLTGEQLLRFWQQRLGGTSEQAAPAQDE